ncbi:MAG: hypothetical protein E6593_01280 [Clostridium sp.]|nr:hypothetical protein [Clostridium sp.]
MVFHQLFPLSSSFSYSQGMFAAHDAFLRANDSFLKVTGVLSLLTRHGEASQKTVCSHTDTALQKTAASSYVGQQELSESNWRVEPADTPRGNPQKTPFSGKIICLRVFCKKKYTAASPLRIKFEVILPQIPGSFHPEKVCAGSECFDARDGRERILCCILSTKIVSENEHNDF